MDSKGDGKEGGGDRDWELECGGVGVSIFFFLHFDTIRILELKRNHGQKFERTVGRTTRK